MSDLYGEAPKAKPVIEELVPSAEDKNIYREIEYALNIGDSLIYLTGELEDFASFDFISRCRTILANREDGNDSPINVIINSPGGSMYEMFAIIDYMKSLSVPVNTICRGRAFSAAAMILVCGTGTRFASPNSTIMLHEGSAFNIGKNSDVQASAKHISQMELAANTLLDNVSNKDTNWWKDNTRTDMYLTPSEAMELKLIDKII